MLMKGGERCRIDGRQLEIDERREIDAEIKTCETGGKRRDVKQ